MVTRHETKNEWKRTSHFNEIIEFFSSLTLLDTTMSGFLWNYNLNDSVLGIHEQTDGITRVEYLNFKSSMDEYRVK